MKRKVKMSKVGYNTIKLRHTIMQTLNVFFALYIWMPSTKEKNHLVMSLLLQFVIFMSLPNS